MLRFIGLGRERWRWPLGKSAGPPDGVLSRMAAALRSGGAQRAAQREAVLVHLASLLDQAANPVGAEAARTALTGLAGSDVLEAAAEAVQPDSRPSDAALSAAASLAALSGSASSDAAAAVASSGLLHSLVQSLGGLHAGSEARVAVLRAVRQLARHAATRQALEDGPGIGVLVSALRSSVGHLQQELGLGAEAAWALEMLAGCSRRTCTHIGEEGGVEAAVKLLQAGLQAKPQVAELPRGEEAEEAAANALHALLALATGNRRNRQRLRDAGGTSVLAEAFADSHLSWEHREQAAALLEDLAATLSIDEGPLPAAPAAAAAAGHEAHSSPLARQAGLAPGAAAAPAAATLAEWRQRVLPRLVGVLRARRGGHLEESKAAAAAVLARFAAAWGEAAAVAVAAAGALSPLLQVLHVSMQLAGGERGTALVVLSALQALVPGTRDALLAVQLSAPGSGAGTSSRQASLLDLLLLLMEDAAAAAAVAAEAAPVFGSGTGLAAGYSSSAVVRAGWAAAALAAALCTGQQAAQDAAAARGLLPSLAAFLAAEPPAPSSSAWGEASSSASAPAAAAGGGSVREDREVILAAQCAVAGCLRSFCLRAAHHAAVRASGALPRLHKLASGTGVPVWTEMRAAARQALQAMGELPDTDRPLLTYSAVQLAALLEAQAIDASRFQQRGITGAEFVRLSDAELRSMAAAAQLPRLLRVLRAWEAFCEVDAADGQRDGALSLSKLVAYLSYRGFRSGEVVPLAEGLLQLMDHDRDDRVSFPDFLSCYDEYQARTLGEEAPPSKRRRTSVLA